MSAAARYQVRIIRRRTANSPSSLVEIVDTKSGQVVETMTGRSAAEGLVRHIEACDSPTCRRCPRAVRLMRQTH